MWILYAIGSAFFLWELQQFLQNVVSFETAVCKKYEKSRKSTCFQNFWK